MGLSPEPRFQRPPNPVASTRGGSLAFQVVDHRHDDPSLNALSLVDDEEATVEYRVAEPVWRIRPTGRGWAPTLPCAGWSEVLRRLGAADAPPGGEA